MVYGISCDTSCVSVLRICFELWGKYITGWYLSISGCLHNSDKKVTILFQNCKYSRSHLKSHCCHWLICHFSSRKNRVIPPNTSDPPDSSPLTPRVPFTLFNLPQKVITTCTSFLRHTGVKKLHSLWQCFLSGSQWHFYTSPSSHMSAHSEGTLWSVAEDKTSLTGATILHNYSLLSLSFHSLAIWLRLKHEK